MKNNKEGYVYCPYVPIMLVLNNCSKCNSQAISARDYNDKFSVQQSQENFYYIKCTKCDNKVYGSYISSSAAVKDWNKANPIKEERNGN